MRILWCGVPGRDSTTRFTCEKHPLREAEEKITVLRSALIGLVGAETKEELEGMELAMRSLPAPDADKAASINAIHTILKTMPE